MPTTAGNSDETETKTTADCSTNDHHAQTAGPSSQGTDWATLVSTPLIHSNRFEVLAVTDEEYSDGGNFHEQRSARVKRRRQLSSLQKRRQIQQQQQVTGNDQRNNQQQSSTRRSRAPLVVGRSVSANVSVAAAKQIFKKAVFCVDNVGTSFSADDVRSFVSSMAVNVISCFEVKPRRRPGEEAKIKNRKAFRLCIRADDRDLLLDASKWPN